MSDMCNDNRFELIEKYKKRLIEATNIETAPDEMAVLDDILFRFWQMGWLDKLEQPERKMGKWIDQDDGAYYPVECSECRKIPLFDVDGDYILSNFCPHCGSYNGG